MSDPERGTADPEFRRGSGRDDEDVGVPRHAVTAAAAQIPGEAWLLPRETIDEITWCGEKTFRALSYWFRLEWNWGPLGERACEVLSPLEVAPEVLERRLRRSSPLVTARYALVRVKGPTTDRYWVLAADSPVFGTPTLVDALDWLLWRVNVDIANGARDFFLIHAGAVATPFGDGLILPGKSGAGKSSLVAGLVRRGFGYLSDEFAAIDPVERGLYAVPRAISIKPGSFELFEDLGPPSPDAAFQGSQWHIRWRDAGCYGGDGPHPIRWVIAPRYEFGAPTTVEPLTPAETAYTLGANSLSMDVYGRRALPLLGDVASAASGFRLVSGNLHEAIAAVTDIIGPA